jgi:RHS repeat-associated protein
VHSDYDLDRTISRISPDGIATTIPSYDPVNGRLISVAFAGGSATFAYKPSSGQLQSITTADGNAISYAYDGALLKSTTFSGMVAGTIARTYDADFRLSSESVNGGTPVSFTYDNDALLTGAGAMTITRDPTTGFVTGSTLGSINESHTYTVFGEEKTYTVTSGGATIYSVDYGTRDALGRIVTKTETVLGETHAFVYGYDSRNRLSDVTKDGVAIAHYDYDGNGNRVTAPGLTASPAYDAQDRLTAYGACTYSYKPDGSLQTKTCPDGMTTYDYDSFGNLRNVLLPNGTHLEYVIDGQYRRIGKKVCGTAINVSCSAGSLVEGFVYRSELQPAAWLNGDGSVKATFVYGLKRNMPEYMVKGAATYRLVVDQLGSVRLVVDMSTGAVIERIDRDEFGNLLTDTAPSAQPFGLAGGLWDADIGLVKFGARDYDPKSGTWTTKDPLRFSGGHAYLYGYVGADPVNNFDPTGLLLAPPPGPWYLNPYFDAAVIAVAGGVAIWAYLHHDSGATPIPTFFTPAGPSGPSCHWRDPGTLSAHFIKHGKDFAAADEDEYAKLADTFLQTSQSGGYPTNVDSLGNIRVYDPLNNIFGSYDSAGGTKTFYKPDPAVHGKPTNWDYWISQPGAPPWMP